MQTRSPARKAASVDKGPSAIGESKRTHPFTAPTPKCADKEPGKGSGKGGKAKRRAAASDEDDEYDPARSPGACSFNTSFLVFRSVCIQTRCG